MKESKNVCKADSSYDMGFLLEKDEARPFKSYSEVKAHFCKILFNL